MEYPEITMKINMELNHTYPPEGVFWDSPFISSWEYVPGFWDFWEIYPSLKYLISTRSAEVFLSRMSGCHVRICPNTSKLNFRGHMIRAWNELVLKRDKNEILKFWKSEVGFELKSLTLIEKDIISLIIFMLDERRRLAVIHIAHNYDENKIQKSTCSVQLISIKFKIGFKSKPDGNGSTWMVSISFLIWDFILLWDMYFLMVCYIWPILLEISSNKTMILKVS